MWYVAGSLAAGAVHPMLPAAVRPSSYFLIALFAVVPMGLGVRATPAGDRRPGYLLLTALLVLSTGNFAALLDALGLGAGRTPAELLITLGHVFALVSAMAIVRRRGRNDVGGLVDATVVAMAVGGLLWTAVLQPRLAATATPLGTQVTVLINMLVLTGILGALGRLLATSGESLPALRRFVYALVLALVGNVTQALTTGFLATDRPPWVEVMFLACYTCLGAAAMDPSMQDLLRPGPAPEDRLGTRRLLFLGFALALTPVVGGGRQLLGLPVDGLLLVGSTLAVVPLVMIRIGTLSVQRSRAEAALTWQATHDGLTGLPNRTELLNRLSAALAGDGEVALLFCDLDGFKEINDRLGHLAGDELLVQVARRLAGCRAEGDTLARYGGDEFVLISDGCTAEETIRQAMAEPFTVAGEQVTVGASVGVVRGRPGSDPQSLIRRADEAMYAVKRTRTRRATVAA